MLAYLLTSWAIDNIATTLAGISALGVAFFHAAPKNAALSQLRLADVHLTCAAALFILLGAISLFIFPRDVLPNQGWRVFFILETVCVMAFRCRSSSKVTASRAIRARQDSRAAAVCRTTPASRQRHYTSLLASLSVELAKELLQ